MKRSMKKEETDEDFLPYDEPYIGISRRLIRSKPWNELSYSAQFIYINMRDIRYSSSKIFSVTYQKLQIIKPSISDVTIRDGFNELAEKGFIEVIEKGGMSKATKYKLIKKWQEHEQLEKESSQQSKEEPRLKQTLGITDAEKPVKNTIFDLFNESEINGSGLNEINKSLEDTHAPGDFLGDILKTSDSANKMASNQLNKEEKQPLESVRSIDDYLSDMFDRNCSSECLSPSPNSVDESEQREPLINKIEDTRDYLAYILRGL
jgi:hypothetical protein